MADDFYKILGIDRNASDRDIQQAYRKLARKYHPDLSDNKDYAKEQFQKVQQAYDVLSDSKKRKMYDRYGSSYEHMAGQGEQPFGGFGDGGVDFDFSQFFGGNSHQSGGFDDLLRQFAGGGASGRAGGRANAQSSSPRSSGKGRSVEQEMTVPFQTAIQGGRASIGIQRGGQPESITVTIPPGIESGRKIRLKGQGDPSPGGGLPGDLIVKVNVAPHPYFERTGNNLLIRVPISFSEAWLGAKIEIPTPDGTATVTIPERTNSGRKLRLKGQGVASTNGSPGDLLVELMIRLPADSSDKADERIREIAEEFPMADIRSHLRW